KQKEMNRRSEGGGGGSCIAIRTTTTPSTSRFFYNTSSSDPTTSGGPTWMRKGIPCEERLRRLKNRTKVYFDPTRLEHQISFQHLIRKQGAKGAAWEYPFAVAGLNITFMLMKMLDLDANKPRTLVSAVFVHMLSGKNA
ncbi:hypothetical protein M8C21_030911, partial [Ambrosia artemisiifolia]